MGDQEAITMSFLMPIKVQNVTSESSYVKRPLITREMKTTLWTTCLTMIVVVFRVGLFTSEKGKPKSRHCSELKVNDKIITDERELLLAWKFHFEDLYTPVTSVHYNATVKNFVEDKLLEYSAISGSVKEDVLENAFTMEEVCAVCLGLPNKKAGGLDGLTYEHIKYAGNPFFQIFASILNTIRMLEDGSRVYGHWSYILFIQRKKEE